MRSLRMATMALVVGVVSIVSLRAENWPQWRGPDGTGVSQERGLPERWGPKENVAWKATVRGLGASSPIVWGDRVFVTSQVGYGPLTSAPHPPLVGVQAAPGEARDLSQRTPEERPIGGQLFRQSGSISFVVSRKWTANSVATACIHCRTRCGDSCRLRLPPRH